MKRMLLVLAVCMSVTAAFAGNIQWTNTNVSAGDFNTAANWNGAFAGNKLEWYNYSGPPSLNFYSVTLTASAGATFSGWDQDYWANSVLLNTAGFTLDSTGSPWNVGAYGAADSITNLIYGGGTVKAHNAVIGSAQASATKPRFEVYGAGTTFELTSAITVGNNTPVKFYDGAIILTKDQYSFSSIGQSSATAANPGQRNASVEMSGTDTRWYNTGRLVVGYRSGNGVFGNGAFTIKSGAKYYGGNDQMLSGYNYDGTAISGFATKGTLNVQDSGSLFYATNKLFVGMANTGVVTVANGGRLEVRNRVYLGPGLADGTDGLNGNLTGNNTAAYGVLSVSGVGSTASVQRITVGHFGTGAIEALDKGVIETFLFGINLTNGTVKVDDAYIRTQTIMNTGGNNTYNFVLRNKDANEYYLDVGTTLTLGGTDNIYVDLSNFSGSTGQYRLINYSTLSGTFDNAAFGSVVVSSGAYSGTTLENNTGDGYVYLNVIPEPASVLLLVSGLVAAYKLRRRA